jgi:hypothetical protein
VDPAPDQGLSLGVRGLGLLSDFHLTICHNTISLRGVMFSLAP